MPELYRRVAADLRSRISSGEFPAGEKLPPKRLLAEHYKVAQGTIQSALRVLRGEGYVDTAQGSGIYALKPPDRKALTLAERVERLEAAVFGKDGADAS